MTTRTLSGIIATLQVSFAREEADRKQRRYVKEEARLALVRAELNGGDREQWLQDTLVTEDELG